MTGHRFKELRKEWGYSAREIAEHFGRSTSFVYKLERYGNREIPKRWAKALCEFLGIDWEEENEREEKKKLLVELLGEDVDIDSIVNYKPPQELVDLFNEMYEKEGDDLYD